MIRVSAFQYIRLAGAAALLVSAASIASAGSPCDIRAGAEVFATKCATCHTVVPGQNGPAGPNLHGVVGRRPARAPGFAYSAAMASRTEAWTAATLDWYLIDPPARVPGTTMAFSGLKNDDARAAVLCFLQTLDNTPTSPVP